MKSLLDKLDLREVNTGACCGYDGWITESESKELVSYNPTTGEPIASILQATPAAYEIVVAAAQAAFLKWSGDSCTKTWAGHPGPGKRAEALPGAAG